jgi:AcrR family transcriptional regulator
MGIVERREREREGIRRKILDAARELFATEGYESVTMRRIAEAIEYSPTTIYNHFEDKDDLVNCLCEEDFSRLLGHLQTQPPPDDPIEWIRQLGLAYAAFATEYPNHYRFMFMTPTQFKAGHEHELSSSGMRAFELLRMAVRKALDTGRFRPGSADTLAQVLWASVHGAVALLVTYDPQQFPCAPAAPDLVEQVIENSLRGLLAPSNETR